MANTSEILEFNKENYQKNEEKCILQYGCSICGIVFDTKDVCDNHLKNCASGDVEHHSQSETSSYTISDQAPNEHLNIPKRLEDTYSESSVIHIVESDEIRNSDEYLEQQNSELDKEYGISSKMLSDNEIFITLPFDGAYAYSEKNIEYCDDKSIGVKKNNEECEMEYKLQLSTKNVNTKTICSIGITGHVTNNTVTKNQHKIVNKDSTRAIHKNHNLVLTKFDAPKKSVRENDVEIMENDRDLSILFETVELSIPSNKGNDTSTQLTNVGDDKNYTSGSNSPCLEQCGKQNTKLGTKESKDGTLYSRTNRFQLIKPKKYASKQEAKRKKQKEYMQTLKKRKSQKQMQILIEKTKQSLNSVNCIDNLVDYDELEALNIENGDTSQCQKTNRSMYTIINKEGPKIPEDQDKFQVYEFFDEEDEKIKKHLMKQREKKKEEKNKTCGYCEKTFENPIEVLRHKREAHKFPKITLSREELQPYLDSDNYTECPLCFKSLRTGYRSVYARHILTHCDEYKYKCRICEQLFRRVDHCISHEKRHVVSVG